MPKRAEAARAIAWPMGCSEASSTAPASSSASFSSVPETVTTSATVIVPAVSVPVLSSTTTRIFRAASSARALDTRMPSPAPRPTAAINAVGMARPSAHGQATTRTATAALQASGQQAAFAGDGVNDAAALAQASLGMAIGTGTDAAIGAADLTLVSGDPAGIADAIQLARATMSVIRANLAWASAYNAVAIPLAALGYLNPLFAGIAMSASSLIVVANSLRLRRFTPASHGRAR